jgi:hypothetical protein
MTPTPQQLDEAIAWLEEIIELARTLPRHPSEALGLSVADGLRLLTALKANRDIVCHYPKATCVSEQGQSGILWTVFEGDPFCSRRIASFSESHEAGLYLAFIKPY